MPSPTAWPSAAQAAINAIREVDSTTSIYVEGDHWSSAAGWGPASTQTNPNPLYLPYQHSVNCGH